MVDVTVLCRNSTTFTKSKELDEEAFGEFLQRFVDARIGVYLGSGGSGEGHALSREELRRVYTIGVAVCKGKIPVNGNPPEQHSAQSMIEHAKVAVESGVEIVNIYGPASWHGFRPTDAEFIAFFDDVLKVIKHPVGIAPNQIVGYTPKPAVLAGICDRYRQIAAVNLSAVNDTYFINLKDAIKREIPIYVQFSGSLPMLALGAAGLLCSEANLVPKTFQRYIEFYKSGDIDALSRVYADLQRLIQYLAKWQGASPRWVKMAMRAFKLPGGEGGSRSPYVMPSDNEVQLFIDGLLRLHLPEIDEMAGKAGLSLSAP